MTARRRRSVILSAGRGRAAHPPMGRVPRPAVLTSTEPQLVKAQGSLPIDDIADAELVHAEAVEATTQAPGEAKTHVPVEAMPSAPDQGIQSGVAEGSANTPNPAGEQGLAVQPPSLHSVPADPVVKDDRTVQRNDEASRDTRLAAVEETRSTNSVTRTPEFSAGSQIGEGKRTLHLSLQGNGAAAAPPPSPHPTPQSAPSADTAAQNTIGFGRAPNGRPGPHPQGGQPGSVSPPRQAPVPAPPYGSAASFGGMRSPAGAPEQSLKTRDNSSFIDHALRERINEDIAAFLAAFDAALDHDTSESRTELREATDRLLRAGARTRIRARTARGAYSLGLARG